MSDSLPANGRFKNPQSFLSFLVSLGPGRLIAMATVSLFMLGAFIFLFHQFNKPSMTLLYSELSFDDSTSIIKKLDALNVPYEAKQDGSVILVPKDELFKIRMKLAEDGLPAGGNVGYEIFDQSGTLGATNFVQNINKLRALEGELSRTIKSLSSIKDARVHLVLPERKLFEKNKPTPSASIILKTRGQLNLAQVNAVTHLVASAVEGLKTDNISIIDQNGQLLAATKHSGMSPHSGLLLEKKAKIEANMARRLEAMLGQIVGLDHVKVQVSADLDFDRLSEQSEIYDPDKQVIVSSQTREENNASKEPLSGKGVSVGKDLPGDTEGEDGKQHTSNQSAKNEEITNFSNSKTIRNRTVESGRVKRLSVAVLIDGIYEEKKDAPAVYKARKPEEITKLEALVKSAIGYDAKRGDKVQITNLQFMRSVPPKPSEGEGGMFDLTKADYFYIAELVVTLLLSLLFLLLVLRPLMKKALTSPEGEFSTATTAPEQASAPASAPPLADDAPPNTTPNETANNVSEHQTTLADVTLAKNQASLVLNEAVEAGKLEPEAVAQIGEMVTKNPDEASSVLRQWLQEDAA